MALIKANGTYIKITSVRTDDSTAEYEIYQNADARLREKNGEWTEFDRKMTGSFNTAIINELVLKAPIISNYTLEDTFKSLCYIAMLCDASAFGGSELDADTKKYIGSLSSENKASFEESVDHLIQNRPELTKEEQILIKGKVL